MRQQQKKLMQEYLKEITNNTNKEETLFKIIKSEKRTIISFLEWTLALFVVLFFVWGSITGLYKDTNIIIDTTGEICTINGQPNTQNQTLQDYGYKITTPNTPNTLPIIKIPMNNQITQK